MRPRSGAGQQVYVLEAWDLAGNTRRLDVSSGGMDAGANPRVLLDLAMASLDKPGGQARANELLDRATKAGLDPDRIPLWLLEKLANTTQSARLLIEHPAEGQVFRGVILPVRGTLTTVPDGTTVHINGAPVPIRGDRFEHDLNVGTGGAHEIVVEARLPDGERLRRVVKITVQDPDADATAWTGGTISRAQREWAKRLNVPLAFENEIGMRFVLIAPGQFQMGFAAAKTARTKLNERAHAVDLTKPFYMQITEVTNAQYKRLHAGHSVPRYRGYGLTAPKQPVVSISYLEARAFAAWLTKRDPGRTYRLPTEAEWEFCARGGHDSDVFPWKGGRSALGKHANVADTAAKTAFGDEWTVDVYDTNDGRATSAEVASYAPNPYGLFDMVGNVAEWVSDWWGAYTTQSAVDPTGPELGVLRCYRGGSWIHGRGSNRVSKRFSAKPIEKTNYRGFRLVVEVK